MVKRMQMKDVICHLSLYLYKLFKGFANFFKGHTRQGMSPCTPRTKQQDRTCFLAGKSQVLICASMKYKQKE